MRNTEGFLAIDEGVFSNYGEEAEYWCGVLATDGCVDFPKPGFIPRVQYGSIDLEHVYKFRDFLKSEHRVLFVTRTGLGRLSKAACLGFRNKRIGEFLICNGITPRKTLTLAVSDRLAKSPHFWRGALDGDGSVAISKNKYAQPAVILSSSSFLFINQFAEFCLSIGLRPKISNIQLRGFSKVPQYRVGFGSQQAIQLLTSVYSGATVWLDRKKIKVDQIFAQPVRQRYSRAVEGIGKVRVGSDVVLPS